MQKEIKGYKAFYSDSTNKKGNYFEEGHTYHIDGDLSVGTHGNGFHMVTDLADVFRFFDGNECLVAEVTGYGKTHRYDEDYCGSHDMYVVSDITINHFMSREEIVNRILSSSIFSIKKFIMYFPLTEKERALFTLHCMKESHLLDDLLYYRYGVKDIYTKPLASRQEERAKVLVKAKTELKKYE